MGVTFCPVCGKPATDSHRRDFLRCEEADCGIAFIEDPYTEVIDDSILRAASTLARRGLSASAGVVRRAG